MFIITLVDKGGSGLQYSDFVKEFSSEAEARRAATEKGWKIADTPQRGDGYPPSKASPNHGKLAVYDSNHNLVGYGHEAA